MTGSARQVTLYLVTAPDQNVWHTNYEEAINHACHGTPGPAVIHKCVILYSTAKLRMAAMLNEHPKLFGSYFWVRGTPQRVDPLKYHTGSTGHDEMAREARRMAAHRVGVRTDAGRTPAAPDEDPLVQQARDVIRRRDALTPDKRVAFDKAMGWHHTGSEGAS